MAIWTRTPGPTPGPTPRPDFAPGPARGAQPRTAAGPRARRALAAVLLPALAAALLADLAVLAPPVHAGLFKPALTKEQKKALEALAPQYRAWLEEVEFLITKDEKRAFLDLKEDYQRDAFIERFWEVRDRGGPSGDFRRNWQRRIVEARARFGRLSGGRARVFLLNGPPTALVAERCDVLPLPIETWSY